LDGYPHWKIEVIDLFTDDESNAAGNKGPATAVVSFHKEDLLPQTKMRLDAQESLTQCDKDSNMED
jgi:hypothetical protein